METEQVALKSELQEKVQVSNKSWFTRRKVCVVTFILLLLIAASVTVYMLVQHNKYNDKEAVHDVQSSLIDLVQNYNESVGLVITDGEESLMVKAFKHFDKNSDNKLSKDEYYNFYVEFIDFNKMYNIIDIDNDTIISYKELVFHIFNKNKYSNMYKKLMAHTVKKNYNYTLNATDETNNLVWSQYAAHIYMTIYDKFSKGYLTKKDILNEQQTNMFTSMDLNDDGFIDFDEFRNHYYNEIIIKFLVNDRYQVKSSGAEYLNYTLDHLNKLNVDTCCDTPILDRRRLQTALNCTDLVCVNECLENYFLTEAQCHYFCCC